jgi:thioredoxin reductase
MGRDRDIQDVVIIGAGPAGLAAAIQLRRYGIAPLVLEGSRVGGLLRNAHWVENYPGFPGGISGPELVALLEKQAREAGVEIIYLEVRELDYQADGFRVITPACTYWSRVAILASGTKPRILNEPPVPDPLKDLIYYEVHHLWNMSGKRMVIMGAGDAAFDYALHLSRENEVVILNHSDRTQCLPLLRERASLSARITCWQNTRILRVVEADQGGILLECTGPDGPMALRADHLIGAIGRDPRLDYLSPSLSQKVSGLKNQGLLYSIGDVHNGIFRQTAIAVGEGIRAAMEISRLFPISGNTRNGK